MGLKALENKIAEKVQAVKDLVAQDNIEGATKAKQELSDLQAKYDLLKDLAENPVPENKKPETTDSVKAFAQAARMGFPRNTAATPMTEGTNSDGGYTVPEDIMTQIEHYRDSKFSLRQLVKVATVSTLKGQQTFKVRADQTGFSEVAENGKIGAKATPTFERKSWEVKKYAGYFPVTNELLDDTDANIVGELVTWIGDESRVTDNKLILAQINTKTKTKFTCIDDIKTALTVTLGSAFTNTSKIVTNDSGLNYLDGLKDSQNRYLLTPSPADPMQKILAAGALTIPIVVVPNCDLPCVEQYSAATETTCTTGKDYYTRTGSAEPYTYTKVASPTGNPSTSSYFQLDGYEAPMIVGDLMEFCELKDRKSLSIKNSDMASIGELNAFEEDLTIWRAIERLGVMGRDSTAIVNGYILLTDKTKAKKN